MGKEMTDYTNELGSMFMAYGKNSENTNSLDKEGLELAMSKEDYEGKKQDREQRKSFAAKIFWFICAYMTVVMAVVVLSGLCVIYVSDSVLIAMLTTTTATVLGLFVIVAKYLFHTKD